MIPKYNAVLAFDETLNNVLLLKKISKLSWFDGRWNGVGGGMDLGESPVGSAMREFEEETGIHVMKDDMVGFEHQRLWTGDPRECEIYWYTTVLKDGVHIPQHNDVDEEMRMFGFSWTQNPYVWDNFLCPNVGYLVAKARTFLATPYLDRPN